MGRGLSGEAKPKRVWQRRLRNAAAAITISATALLAILILTFGGKSTLRPPTMDALLLVAISGAAATVVLQIACARHWTRWLLPLSLPLLVIPLIYFSLMTSLVPAADLSLPSGERLHLAIDPYPTDVSYSLWRSSGPSWVWRRTRADLTYSEDGRFVGQERLALSANGRRVLVGRGGIWTDCLELDQNLSHCALGLDDPAWNDPDFETRMRINSVVLEQAASPKR